MPSRKAMIPGTREESPIAIIEAAMAPTFRPCLLNRSPFVTRPPVARRPLAVAPHNRVLRMTSEPRLARIGMADRPETPQTLRSPSVFSQTRAGPLYGADQAPASLAKSLCKEREPALDARHQSQSRVGSVGRLADTGGADMALAISCAAAALGGGVGLNWNNRVGEVRCGESGIQSRKLRRPRFLAVLPPAT